LTLIKNLARKRFCAQLSQIKYLDAEPLRRRRRLSAIDVAPVRFGSVASRANVAAIDCAETRDQQG
jgi:hypothetical protein